MQGFARVSKVSRLREPQPFFGKPEQLLFFYRTKGPRSLLPVLLGSHAANLCVFRHDQCPGTLRGADWPLLNNSAGQLAFLGRVKKTCQNKSLELRF
jgi:hypothetical protein